jgi:Flp pilus assembly protein TadD
MKKRFLTIIAVFAAVLYSGPIAYMASKPETMLQNSPVPPMNGRKSEANFYSMLNNSGREYNSWLRDGKNYLNRREYEQAIWAFRKAAALRPASEEIHFLLAWTYEKRGAEGLPGDMTDWENLAIREYTAAVEIADHLPSRFNLAILHRKNNRFSEARRHLEHIVLVDSQNHLGRKAAAELAAVFEQDMRPHSISSTIRDGYRNQ